MSEYYKPTIRSIAANGLQGALLGGIAGGSAGLFGENSNFPGLFTGGLLGLTSGIFNPKSEGSIIHDDVVSDRTHRAQNALLGQSGYIA